MDFEKTIKKRNIFVGLVLSIITLGLYIPFWFWKTKREINILGGNIPTTWLVLIPFVSIYWGYKYSNEYARIIEKKDSGLLYFFLLIFIFPIFPVIIQLGLNKFGIKNNSKELDLNSSKDENISLSQNELNSKSYILMYKEQYSRDSIKQQLITSGITEQESEDYMNKYYNQ